MDKTIVKDGWLYRNGFLRKNCKIRLTDITQMKRKKNLFGEALILHKNTAATTILYLFKESSHILIQI